MTTLDLRLPDARGGRPILEAACLPGGAAIFALGEAGAAVYRDGELERRFEATAHHLSVSDDGRQAIAISQAPDEDRCRLSRIDLEGGAESPWCEIARDRTNRYARTFDGERWFTACERGIGEITVQRVDPTAPGFHVTQAVAESGMLVGIERAGGELWVESTSIGAAHYTLYALPSLKMTSRGDIRLPKILFPPKPGQPFELFVGSALPPFAAEPVFAVGGPTCVDPRLMGAPGTWTVPLPGTPLGLRALGPWVAASVEVEEGCELWVMDLRSRRWASVIRFPGATTAGAELQGDALWAWDNRGRAAAIDLGRGEVLQMVQILAGS